LCRGVGITDAQEADGSHADQARARLRPLVCSSHRNPHSFRRYRTASGDAGRLDCVLRRYPIHGFVRFREPWSRYDDAVIAWGGVAAQAAFAVPLVTWVAIFGFTRSDAVNVAIGILGYYSLFVAVFNLIPAPPLDGVKAWYLIPELIKRARNRRAKPKRVVGWRG